MTSENAFYLDSLTALNNQIQQSNGRKTFNHFMLFCCVSDIKQCVLNSNHLNVFLILIWCIEIRMAKRMKKMKERFWDGRMDNALCIIWCNHAALSCHSGLMDSQHCAVKHLAVSFSIRLNILFHNQKNSPTKSHSVALRQTKTNALECFFFKWPKYDQWIDQRKCEWMQF